jgi:hypothetical protein
MQPPPIIPTETAARTLRLVVAVSRANAWSVAGFGGLCAVVALVRLDAGTVAWTLPVIAAGLWELSGTRRLQAGDARGLRHMIRAQLLLLGVIWLYAWLRLKNFNAEAFWSALPGFVQDKVNADLLAAGLDPEFDRDPVLHLTNLLVCVILALVPIAYQGGLVAYYATRTTKIRAALVTPPPGIL